MTGFNNASEDENNRSKKPVLSNNQEGVAAWLDTDKNGNTYLSLKLPLGLGHVNIFPQGEESREGFNKLTDHLQEGGRL